MKLNIYIIVMVFLFAILFCICYIVEHRFFLCTSICVYEYLTIDFLISSAGVFFILLIFFFMYLVSVISGQLSSSRTVRFSLAQGDKPRCRIPWKIYSLVIAIILFVFIDHRHHHHHHHNIPITITNTIMISPSPSQSWYHCPHTILISPTSSVTSSQCERESDSRHGQWAASW